ncbi:hypothetical protein [Bacillus sp. REN16]|uniref:hypothetical protein n=1 Tax=Bacillus sp. REN16 TaxID=2887296 RepID=UPI001E5DCAFC|nr:hypothetical protein [Bacillus sp. REN16]MCC3357795.1 hypothetical protein [Bacillus sp. REN16]
MGHDISGYNKAGEEIAYARFGMSNYNSTFLYSFLDADEYYAGVSGTGGGTTFSTEQIEKALYSYEQFFGSGEVQLESNGANWDQKQIQDFILNCLITAQKEGSVKVLFG